MHEDLRALLIADAGVAAIAGDRIAWGARPQGSAVPAVTLSQISRVEDVTMDGPDRRYDSRVQADCRAETYAVALGLWRAVDAVLSGHSGETGDTIFQGVFADGARELHEMEAEPPLFRFSADFTIIHNPKG